MSRGRAFGARASPAPFGLGARLGGRSHGPYTSEHRSPSQSPLVLGVLVAACKISRKILGQHERVQRQRAQLVGQACLDHLG